MLKEVSHWIGGQPVRSCSGKSGKVWNPADGRCQATVAFADSTEVDLAASAASKAFSAWRSTPLASRAEPMFRLRELLIDSREMIARLISCEHGKTVSDAMGEIARGVEAVEFACGVPHLLKGSFSEQVSRGVDVCQINQPLGVVAGITPFNFPAMVPLWMCAIAVACGNCFVLKPSERDPSASLILAELFQKAGFPDGVFNVIQGDSHAVTELIKHPDVKAVSFVGSTPVAKLVYESVSQAGKRVQALGGAKNHMVVLQDADIEVAADAAVSAGFGSAGQRCMAISVVIAVGACAEPLVEAIEKRIAGVKIGRGDQEGIEMGPLVTLEHRDRVAAHIDDAARQGAEVRVDGRDHPISQGPGFFLGCTLLDKVKPGMRCYDEEIFGPVLGVVRVETFDEALRLVNENPFGNGAAVFTQNGATARRFQFEVQAGMVGINVPIPVPVSYYSFGGWKSSLFGDLHIYGPDAMRFYTKSKVVTSRWPNASIRNLDLDFPAPL